MARRVFITGLGPVSSIGTGRDDFTEALFAGRTGTGPIESFDASGFPHRMAGEVKDFDPADHLTAIAPDDWGRASQFAAAAARLAVADAGVDPEALRSVRAGACIGTTGGEAPLSALLTEQGLRGGGQAMDAPTARRHPATQIGAAVNRELGMRGEALTVSTACSASNYAIGYAYDQITTGAMDYMVAGGADAVALWVHAGFFRLGAVAADRCRPFDADRAGILVGEGGAALFLESEASATARGAHVYAEVLGYGLNCDAKHVVAPDADAIAECTRVAHRDANVKASEVDLVCAHGTGTPANDSVEAAALRQVFGARMPPVTAIKAMLGHTMGAASGFGAIASALAIDTGRIPPTANHGSLGADMQDLDLVTGTARTATVNVVQNNGFAFGGNNAIVMFGRPS
jgi:3-oxoacyl-[acyl-carrier-protein] synthase II